jgi:hypothetical protein
VAFINGKEVLFGANINIAGDGGALENRVSTLEDTVSSLIPTVDSLESRVAELEAGGNTGSGESAIILDSAAYRYFCYGRFDTGQSDSIVIKINGGDSLLMTDFEGVGSEYKHALGVGGRVFIENLDTSTLYITTDGNTIHITTIESESDYQLEMDDEVTIVVAGNSSSPDGFDELVGDINTALDTIIEIQESLIGSEV